VRDFEFGTLTPIANNIAAMRRAIEAAGVILIEENGKPVGIRIAPDAHPETSLRRHVRLREYGSEMLPIHTRQRLILVRS
jgi:hypothetical protein